MLEINLNHFSLISRLFGNLFYREPTDPILANVFGWLQQQGLSRIWPLDTDNETEQALASVQMAIDPAALAQEYDALFAGEEPAVPSRISAYGLNVEDFIAFRQERGMPALEQADHFALLLLTASWLEDNVNSPTAQHELFETWLLPCAAGFLTKVESRAILPFYRSLSLLCREILAAMADELEGEE
ncbi:molecular chaperone [Pasteurellaceae bacterium LIM206]|nr:molecular chaperone [Pasteurellaceae bacterium LIM206]